MLRVILFLAYQIGMYGLMTAAVCLMIALDSGYEAGLRTFLYLMILVFVMVLFINRKVISSLHKNGKIE